MVVTESNAKTSKSEKRQTALVTGGSRGLGRGIVEALAAKGMSVVAIARDPGHLASLAREVDVRTVAADVSDEVAAARIVQEVRPDLLVLCAGAASLMRPIHLHTWRSFSEPWETDTKGTFAWVREAMLLPLPPGSHVLVVSSGAAIQGSPLSGGYAGAKRAQWFIADYAAGESKRLGLGLRFHCLLPTLNPSTDLGRAAIAAYAAREGVSVEQFAKRFSPPLTPAIMGQAVVDLHEDGDRWPQVAYYISGAGLAPVG
jgi:NAD(P)-dependent dehydrogenase (short-subunit alcohol dehydrogenase family)